MLEYRALRRPLYRWIGSLTVCAAVWLWQLAPVVWQGPDGVGWSPFVGALLAVWMPVTLGCYLNWQYRASQNAHSLSCARLRWSPRWGVIWWLLPAANLVMPLLVVRELWQRSCAGDSLRLVYCWWTLLICCIAGGVLATLGVSAFDGGLMLLLSVSSGLLATAWGVSVAMRITAGLEGVDRCYAVLPEPEPIFAE